MPPPPAPVNVYELLWYQKNLEDAIDQLRFNVRVVFPFGSDKGASGIDFTVPQAEIDAEQGATIEDRIIKWLQTKKGQTVEKAKPPQAGGP